ncbi:MULTISPECIES: replication-relaxation family protein [unclassified Crossiella]|uniref:replication-relaxation family protein n=1 Tax=unclassified Crossiella TaxID=2620835 RepID=UPI001FFF48AB|nr:MULTISPECIES: replication-relaxation family protein [unclassified Crossiella]MCK2241854.1 replication-relaxation family protein [Crossiella sp. S99.2]MCK2255757.1 replication-relaxation family protein [Crossiella sp. S99.1]
MITNVTPQRKLRGHLPQRPTPRAAATGAHHTRLAARLTPRDRWLARMLFEHRVLTTHQIEQLTFPSTRAANHRLRQLYLWRVLDRFQPFITTGTMPMHYILDTAGATTLAHEDDLAPEALGYRHTTAIGIAHSLRLAHTIGVNGLFTTLIAHARRPATRSCLTAWWPETRCAAHFGDIVRPDAYGRWQEDGREFEFFLEYDFGTESLTRLTTKLTDYARLAAATAIRTPVLFHFPSHRREATARRALAEATASLVHPALVPIATTTAGSNATTGWLPLAGPAADQRRLELIALADLWPITNSATTTEPERKPTAVQTRLTPPTPMPPSPAAPGAQP